MPRDQTSCPNFRAFGRKGGLVNAARNGGDAVSAPARRAFLASFEAKVDPEGTLSPEDRAARARALLRARMGELSRNAVETRRQKSTRRPSAAPPVPATAALPAPTAERYCIAADGESLITDRVAVTREAGQAVLAGGDLELWCRGVRGPDGHRWDAALMRRILLSGHVAGLRRRSRHLEIAPWPPIFTAAEIEVLRRLLAPGNALSPYRYPLTGLVRCGKCGAVMVGRKREDGAKRYFCSHCGGLYILAGALEAHVWDLVVERLVERGGTALGMLTAEVANSPLRLDRIFSAYAHGLISRSDAETALRRERHERTLGEEVAGWWQAASPGLRRLVIGEMLDGITIQPGRRGLNRFDPDRVRPIDWGARYADADPRTHRPASTGTRGESAEIVTSELNPVGGEPRAESAPAGDEH